VLCVSNYKSNDGTHLRIFLISSVPVEIIHTNGLSNYVITRLQFLLTAEYGVLYLKKTGRCHK
jgi:hypothetical protein